MPSIRFVSALMLTTALAVGVTACDATPKGADTAAAPANEAMAAPTSEATSAPVVPATAPEPGSTPAAVSTPDDGAKPIRFPAGGTAVTIAGRVDGADDRYSLDAQGGQRMRVRIADASNAVWFAVYPPSSGPGGVALVRGARQGQPFAGTLPTDGRYLIQVYRDGGTAAADYRLSVAIDPPGSTPPSPASQPTTGAPAGIVSDYYAALDHGDYRAAYRLWEGDGQASGKSFGDFRQGFGDTRRTSVRVTGPVETEGAAGSVYATVPVAVDATQADGTHRRFTGSYVLRRVNDVPGSSATERSWHLHSAKLQPAG